MVANELALIKTMRIVLENELDMLDSTGVDNALYIFAKENEYLKDRREAVYEEIKEITLSNYNRNNPDTLDIIQRLVRVRNVEIYVIDEFIKDVHLRRISKLKRNEQKGDGEQ